MLRLSAMFLLRRRRRILLKRRARLMVEQEVPPARRGPGWDRHWRELEAYLDEGVTWGMPQGLDDSPPEMDKKRADPKTSPESF